MMKLPVGLQCCLKNKKRAIRSSARYVLGAFVIGLSEDAKEMLVDGPSVGAQNGTYARKTGISHCLIILPH